MTVMCILLFGDFHTRRGEFRLDGMCFGTFNYQSTTDFKQDLNSMVLVAPRRNGAGVFLSLLIRTFESADVPVAVALVLGGAAFDALAPHVK